MLPPRSSIMSESPTKINIIGIEDALSLQLHQKVLKQCTLIIATNRHAGLLQTSSIPVHPITPLKKAFDEMKRHLAMDRGPICVLASGDPLFFGIAGTIIQQFGASRVQVFPALSSLQMACARFKLPWNDAHLLSLHGRRSSHLPGLLLNHAKSLAFTDNHNSPDTIAGALLEYLYLIGEETLPNTIIMHIAENLGMDGECISHCSLQEAATRKFSNLNVIAVQVPELRPSTPFGLNVEELAHSRGLITKDEVRAVSLHALRLPPRGIFWDIGGGSGSISIEAAAIQPELIIYTVEHRAEELANIKENIKRFQLFNIIPLAGRAKDLLNTLPPPDRIFVGGSDGEMGTIINTAARRLPAEGRIVVNSVTERTRKSTPQLLQDAGFFLRLSTISICREEGGTSSPLNPITIITGTFPAGSTQAGTP